MSGSGLLSAGAGEGLDGAAADAGSDADALVDDCSDGDEVEVGGGTADGPRFVDWSGGLMGAGMVAGVETPSVVMAADAARVVFSLYPTRKPSAKKTAQTATPARKTRKR